MRSQCPVSTQMSTSITESEKDRSSARVKRPQQPNEILFCGEQGLVRYWHIGNKRNANAIVARTAVQMVKTTCTESKKKNMTSRDTEAPMGRNRACVESIV